jgi:hypothetical protein
MPTNLKGNENLYLVKAIPKKILSWLKQFQRKFMARMIITNSQVSLDISPKVAYKARS